jgi:GNAT superfamily N-acetyltransferase
MHQVRLATMADVPELQKLIEQSARGLSAGYYTAAQIESTLRYVFGADTRLIADGTYYVIEAEGRIVACGGWSRRQTLFGGDQMKQGEDPLLAPASDAARIRAFFVHPEWARRGLGRLLIERSIEAARAAGFARMELIATLPGEPLYRAAGFAETERFSLSLPDGVEVPVVRMSRAIGSPRGSGLRA